MDFATLVLILAFAHHRPAPKPVMTPTPILYVRVDEWGLVYLAPTQRQADEQVDRPWFFLTEQRLVSTPTAR